MNFLTFLMAVPQKIVLLVDDDFDDHLFFKFSLSEVTGNFDLKSIRDGQAALDYFNDATKPVPDYIFLDINMPVVNGFTCLQKMRKLPHMKDVATIIWTTSSREEDREEARRLGATAFFTKPVGVEMLTTSLKFILGQSHMPGRYPEFEVEFFMAM
ncbi:MAG: transcriptional regulator [Bacteroidetes bacterium]|nr:transcriptional regulator [Bacteroidota bacterium]